MSIEIYLCVWQGTQQKYTHSRFREQECLYRVLSLLNMMALRSLRAIMNYIVYSEQKKNLYDISL